MGRKCPSCGSDKTIPWLGGIAAGGSIDVVSLCESCGYFGPILSETANSRRVEHGFYDPPRGS